MGIKKGGESSRAILNLKLTIICKPLNASGGRNGEKCIGISKQHKEKNQPV